MFVGSKTVVGTKNEPWRVSVALDEGAPKGRRGRVCVYAQCTSLTFPPASLMSPIGCADWTLCVLTLPTWLAFVGHAAATHNYTLLRTVKEIKETHDKVRLQSRLTLPSKD